MLIYVDRFTARPVVLEGRAHIVVTLRDGEALADLQAVVDGATDAVYASMPDEKLLRRALPELLDELRDQLSRSGST